MNQEERYAEMSGEIGEALLVDGGEGQQVVSLTFEASPHRPDAMGTKALSLEAKLNWCILKPPAIKINSAGWRNWQNSDANVRRLVNI